MVDESDAVHDAEFLQPVAADEFSADFSDANAYTDADAGTHFDAYSDADADTDAGTHFDTYSDAYSNSDTDPNADPDPTSTNSTTVTFTPQGPMPPGRPEAPDLSPSSAAPQTALSVTWNAPADNGSAITGYRLRYRVKGAQSWASVNTTSTSTVLSGLTAATTYEAQVLANNSVGSGVWSPTGTGATLAYPVPTPTNGSPTLGAPGSPSTWPRTRPPKRKSARPSPPRIRTATPSPTPSAARTSSPSTAATGQISVAQGAALDYESVSSYTVTVSVTDGVDAAGNADPAVTPPRR